MPDRKLPSHGFSTSCLLRGAVGARRLVRKEKNSNAPDQIRHRAGDHVSTYLRISSRLSKRKKAEILPLGAMEAFLLGDKDWLVMFHRLPADQGVRTANKTERDPQGKLRRRDTSKLPTYGTAGNEMSLEDFSN